MPIGKVVSDQIEIFPTFARIAAGHRLRLTLSTSDARHLAPMPSQLLNPIGGIYMVQRTASASSYLEVEQASPSAFTACRPDASCALTRAAEPPSAPVRRGCQNRSRERHGRTHQL